MKIYIAGQITGLPYRETFDRFRRVERQLHREGHFTVNPMTAAGTAKVDDAGTVTPEGWADYMKRDIALLLSCDAIYLMNNWKLSRGARLEQFIATELGIERIYESG